MAVRTDVGLRELLRDRPAQTFLHAAIPLLVAVAQFVNSLYHGVSLVVPVAFAVVLVGFSILATQLQLAALRRTRLETGPAR